MAGACDAVYACAWSVKGPSAHGPDQGRPVVVTCLVVPHRSEYKKRVKQAQKEKDLAEKKVCTIVFILFCKRGAVCIACGDWGSGRACVGATSHSKIVSTSN